MNDLFSLTTALVSGLGAGGLFFGGLWLTVRRLGSLKHPGIVILLSYLARVAAVLGVFWWISQHGLLHIALCLAGFLIARLAVTKIIGAGQEAETSIQSEDGNSCT